MRFLLANYISEGRVDIVQAGALIPDIHYNPEEIEKRSDPRIIKTHESFNPKYNRVIYLVRDVKDVAVSYFFHLKKFHELDENMPFEAYLDSFIAGSLDAYGPWGDHVEGWSKGVRDLLLIRYEDMLTDTESALESVLKFAGIACEQERISSSVAACALSKLRKIETRQQDEIEIFSSSDKSMNFFRKGVSGDWRNHFSDRDLEKVNTAFASVMNRIGYSSI